MVTHANLMANEEMIRQAFVHDEDSTVVGWAPFFHDQGLIGNLLQPLYAGSSCIFLSPVAFVKRPLLWLKTISRYRAATSGGPNFAYELCVRAAHRAQLSDLDLSTWTLAFNGAEPVRHDTIDRFSEAFTPFGFRREAFYPCYGLAESTLFVTGCEKGTPPHVVRFDKQALEEGRALEGSATGRATRPLVSCGRGHCGTTVVVVDPELRVPCGPGEIGEIWVSGPAVAAGYWNKPQQTEETFRARLAGSDERRFLRTGDLGCQSAAGDLYVTGRVKDVIILLGRNHYPHDIELTAQGVHPGLRDGAGAAFAVGEEGSEQVVIVQEVERSIRPSFDPDAVSRDIRRAVIEAHDFGTPHVLLVGSGVIPKTTSGKVQRALAKAMFLAQQFQPWSPQTINAPSQS
jgi:acyl-CoA synthetase (AMP-forming)/AMP-acid ligase II